MTCTHVHYNCMSGTTYVLPAICHADQTPNSEFFESALTLRLNLSALTLSCESRELNDHRVHTRALYSSSFTSSSSPPLRSSASLPSSLSALSFFLSPSPVVSSTFAVSAVALVAFAAAVAFTTGRFGRTENGGLLASRVIMARNGCSFVFTVYARNAGFSVTSSFAWAASFASSHSMTALDSLRTCVCSVSVICGLLFAHLGRVALSVLFKKARAIFTCFGRAFASRARKKIPSTTSLISVSRS